MGTRGYHSYRGRGSTGKKVLAIVLGVILVAAGAFLLLQNRYVVYDENGNAHWELPFGKNKDDGGTPMPDDVVIVREEPQRPQLTELHAQLLPENALRRDAQTVLSQHPGRARHRREAPRRHGHLSDVRGRRAVCHCRR